MRSAPEYADFVVVGAGSAGAAVAARLTQTGSPVVLLEAGPPDNNRAVHIPAAFPQLFRSELDWAYETTPQPALDGRNVFWPRGKVLGGSSSTNAMMWVPGFAADYDEWGELAGPDWSWKSVSGYLEKITGPDGLGIHLSALRSPNPHTRAFLQAASDLGYGLGEHESGFRQTRVTQLRGTRYSSADGYLKPLRKSKHLHVVTGAAATRVLFDGRRAVGVEYRADGVLRQIRAHREVVLSAGTVNTAQLLMLSGIGDPVHLAEHGIDVLAAAPEVGANLIDHLVTGPAVESSGPTLFSAGLKRNIADYLLRRRGPLTSNIVEAYGFTRSSMDLDLPDLELVFLPVPFIDEGRTQPDRDGFTVGTVLLKPHSRGVVRLASANPSQAPVIDPRYLSDPQGLDRAALTAGVKAAVTILDRMVARGHSAGHFIRPVNGNTLRREELVRVIVNDLTQTIYHPVGTARMGADHGSVVDPELQVRGVERLRVADASVMPTIVRGHTHAPAVVIGERCADLILGR